MAISYPGQGEVYLKEAIGAGFARKFLFVDGTKSDDMIKKVGPDALTGTFGTAPGSPNFDANGYVVTPIEVWKIERGEIVTVRFESP